MKNRKWVKMDFKQALIRIKAIEAQQRTEDKLQLMVQVFNPNAVGGTPCVNVDSIDVGFDWDSGKIILQTEKKLTVLSAEDVEAIKSSVRKGQSWHAYQAHKEQDNKIKELKTKLIDLEQINIELMSKLNKVTNITL